MLYKSDLRNLRTGVTSCDIGATLPGFFVRKHCIGNNNYFTTYVEKIISNHLKIGAFSLDTTIRGVFQKYAERFHRILII